MNIWHLESPVIWLFVQQFVQANKNKKLSNCELLDLNEGNPLVTGEFFLSFSMLLHHHD